MERKEEGRNKEKKRKEEREKKRKAVHNAFQHNITIQVIFISEGK